MAKNSRRKRRDSWGSITELEKGRRYRIRYWANDDEGGYRRRSVTVKGTRLDAERRRSELMLDHSKDAPCPTVGEAWKRYALPQYEKIVSEGEYSQSTLDTYKSRWNVHIEPRWGNVQCDSVTALAMQQWFDRLDYRTAVDCNKVLRRIFRLVTKYHPEIPNIMLAGYDMPSKQRVAEQDKEAWTPEELLQIWRAVYGTWLEPTVLLRGYAGLRPGESLAIKGSDIGSISHMGVTVCTIRVDDQVLAHGYGLTERTKNEQSNRVAFMAGAPAERLLDIRAEVGDGYLTHDGTGSWVKQQRVYRNLDKVIAKNDIVRHPHKNMRKTWETAVRWEMKLPPWLSEPLMGHKLPGVTGHYYDKPSMEKMAEVYAEGYLRYPFGELRDQLGPKQD